MNIINTHWLNVKDNTTDSYTTVPPGVHTCNWRTNYGGDTLEEEQQTKRVRETFNSQQIHQHDRSQRDVHTCNIPQVAALINRYTI